MKEILIQFQASWTQRIQVKIYFSNQKFISHNKDITNLIRKRVQELQSLKDPYSLPFLKLLINQ